MKLIRGFREWIERDKKAQQERRKTRLRYVMINSRDAQKQIHAAVRWYGLRSKWETDSDIEFRMYNAVLQMMACYSPEWIAREFPADKEYDGARYEMKDYYSSMDALREAKPFECDSRNVQEFISNWLNQDLMMFYIAGIQLVDELRACQGQISLMEEFMELHGVQPYHIETDAAGNEIVFDGQGNFAGKVEYQRPSYIRGV